MGRVHHHLSHQHGGAVLGAEHTHTHSRTELEHYMTVSQSGFYGTLVLQSALWNKKEGWGGFLARGV